MSEKKPGLMRRFFRFTNSLISWIRIIVLNLAFLFVIVAIFVMVSGGVIPSVPERGALVLDIKGTVVDQLSYMDPIVGLLGESNPYEQETLLQDVIDAIALAKQDERITSLIIKQDYLAYAGISKMQEIATALDDFRSSGKKIVAIGDHFNQDQYFLAAQADEIYLNPMGGVSLQGYGVYRNYFQEALTKLEVNYHVFRVGTFKSALEPFIRNDMSDQAKQANLAWLSQLWGQYSSTVAERRGITAAELDNYIDGYDKQLVKYQGDTALAAVAAGLVDGLKSRDEINQYLIEVAGASDDEDIYQAIDYEDYLWIQALEPSEPLAAERVGVIVAAGIITDGEQPPGAIGGDTLAGLIREARRDSAIKALVLRIDSGGGSAFASEVIRRELQLLREQGKPLVVSMGSVAASGGYWISAQADQIWATPTTLTGSIGIFGAFPSLDKTLSKVGVYTDGVGTSPMAGAFRIDRPMEPIAARAIQASVEHGYGQFLEVVADGRDMTTSQVEAIAEGRVWSGLDARHLGLVDELGGFNDVVAAAAKLAGLDSNDYQLIEMPLSPQEQLLRSLGSVVMPPMQSRLLPPQMLSQLQRLLAPFQQSLNFMVNMNDARGLYAHCMGCIAP